MDVETGIFIENEPQMWYPPSTHHQGYVQERHQFTHCPGHDQLQGQVFMMGSDVSCCVELPMCVLHVICRYLPFGSSVNHLAIA
eukprot:6047204-Amphidinium_carterae.1